MKTLVVLHTFFGNYPAQAAEAHGLLVRSGGSGDTAAVVYHDDSASRERLIEAAPSGHLFLVEAERYDPEAWLSVLSGPELSGFDCIVFSGDCAGRELAARLACRVRGTALLDVDTLTKDGECVVCSKRAYGNNMSAGYRLAQRPFCLSLARGGVEPVAAVFHVDDVRELPMAAVPDEERVVPAPEGNSLEEARFIVAVGMGAGDREGVAALAEFARDVGAAFGVSRPVAMSAWAPLDRMIGVSGAMAGPDVCLALGVSGSAAFHAGVERSGFIAAVNTDAASPMVRNADVAVIADCRAVAAELGRLIAADGGAHGPD